MIHITLAKMHKILLDHKPHDFGICLNGGLVSRKTITLLKNGLYKIHNHIDDTEQRLTSEGIQDDSLTNIGKAARKKALIYLK